MVTSLFHNSNITVDLHKKESHVVTLHKYICNEMRGGASVDKVSDRTVIATEVNL